jgi:hypothetical protein
VKAAVVAADGHDVQQAHHVMWRQGTQAGPTLPTSGIEQRSREERRTMAPKQAGATHGGHVTGGAMSQVTTMQAS